MIKIKRKHTGIPQKRGSNAVSSVAVDTPSRYNAICPDCDKRYWAQDGLTNGFIDITGCGCKPDWLKARTMEKAVRPRDARRMLARYEIH